MFVFVDIIIGKKESSGVKKREKGQKERRSDSNSNSNSNVNINKRETSKKGILFFMW